MSKLSDANSYRFMHEYSKIVLENKGQVKNLLRQKRDTKISIAEDRIEIVDTAKEREKLQEQGRRLSMMIDKENQENRKNINDLNELNCLLQIVNERVQKRNKEYK